MSEAKGSEAAAADAQADRQPRVMNPLWIISLFLSLAEVVAGIAMTQAAGGVQVGLVIFVVAFPVAVAAAFFAVVWFRPHHLYAPMDYRSRVNPDEFARALSIQRRNVEIMETSIRQSVENVVPALSKLGVTDEEARKLLAPVVDAPRLSAVRIDFRAFARDLGELDFPVDDHTTVSEFLDTVWSSISDVTHIPIFSFGEHWALRDLRSDQVFRDMGYNWARQNLGAESDYRRLTKVGILPGSELIAIPLRPEWRAGE